jgi:Transposase DDE domain group 1
MSLQSLETWLFEMPEAHRLDQLVDPAGRHAADPSFLDYLFGLARNARLEVEIGAELAEAAAESKATGHPARRFRDFMGTTLESGSRRRRVIGKAECTKGDPNPRFVVTSLKPKAAGARDLYETVYCARGEMENRIKECQLDLFADRTSAATMRANQLRLWFASMAYVLLCAVRRIGLAHTQFAAATCRHHPLGAAQNRRPGADQRPPRPRRHGIRLPVAARVPIGPCPTRGCRPLTNQKPRAT